MRTTYSATAYHMAENKRYEQKLAQASQTELTDVNKSRKKKKKKALFFYKALIILTQL